MNAGAGAKARPRGVPIQVVARLASGSGGASVQATDRRLVTSAGDAFEFGSVHDNASVQVVYNRDLALVVGTVPDGQNCTILSLGATGSGKRQFLFDADAPCVAALAVSQLLAATRSRPDTDLAVQFIEIFNDTVHDLLASAPSPTPLTVDDSEFGPVVPRARSITCADDHDFAIVLSDGVARRTRAMSEHGPFADRASCVMLVTVTTRAGPCPRRTRLMLAEVPGAEKLAVDVGTLRATEGLQINRELIALDNVVRALSDGDDQADFANYAESRTTEVLGDALGGNANAVAVVHVVASDPLPATLAACRLARAMKSVVNYPIVNDERAQGLIRVLRLRYMALLDEVKALRASPAADDKYQDAQQAKAMMVDLQGKVIAAERGRSAAVNEKQKVVAMLADVRAKYRDLLQAKTTLQAELIASEEERLKLSQTLIDMQMHETDLRETLANDKYELETKLLTCEGDIVDLQVKEKRLSDEVREKAKRVEDLERDRQAMSLEYVALRQNYDNVFADLNEARAKNETLGLELLNLVNVKKELTEQKGQLEEQNAVLEATAREATTTRTALADQLQAVQASERVLKVENENLSLVSIKKDVELKQLQTEFEARKVAMERQAIDLIKDKDAELAAFRQVADKEAHKMLSAKVELEKANERLQADVKIAQRRLAQIEADLAALADLNARQDTDLVAVRERLTQQSDEYRRRLLQYVNEASPVEGPAPSAMLGELVREHGAMEARLRMETDEQRQAARVALRRLRKLAGLYRDLAYHVEDGAARDRRPKILSDQEIADLAQEMAQNEASWQAEIDAERARVRNAQAEVEALREDAVRAAEDAKRTQAKLKHDVDELTKAKEQVTLELHLVKTAHAACGATGKASETTGVAVEMLSAIKKDLEMIRTSALGAGALQSQETSAFVRGQLEDLRKENDVLRGRLRVANSGEARGNASTDEVAQLMEDIASLRAQIRAAKEAEDRVLNAADPGRPKTTEEVEKERAAMAMRCARAEAQLKQFQEYLQKQLVAHEKEKRTLKKQVQEWRAKATSTPHQT